MGSRLRSLHAVGHRRNGVHIAHTTVPIPRLHAYSCDGDNALGHPYMIMDKVQGTRLADVWMIAGWWTGERRKEHLFESLAGFMTELAGLEFDQIGKPDRVHGDGPYFVAPFPSGMGLLGEENGPHEEFGPFKTTHAFLEALISLRRDTSRKPDASHFALLQMFVGALPNQEYDGAPFTPGHPDFDKQNIFVDDMTGRVVGIIDWDGVAIQPRELGALVFPAWLTFDWNPMMHEASLEEGLCDTEEDLRRYREMYTDAVRKASAGKFDGAAITRNSHVVTSLYQTITSLMALGTVIFRLGEYAFGSAALTYRLMEGIGHSGWHTGSPEKVPEVKFWERESAFAVDDESAPQGSNSNSEDNVSDTQEPNLGKPEEGELTGE
ncbi:hypothetical protein BD414DRAFT_151379 [Trametes punicea]|nr:hypothetical protein BD414DRAFT_151379 [Trametes punicea]